MAILDTFEIIIKSLTKKAVDDTDKLSKSLDKLSSKEKEAKEQTENLSKAFEDLSLAQEIVIEDTENLSKAFEDLSLTQEIVAEDTESLSKSVDDLSEKQEKATDNTYELSASIEELSSKEEETKDKSEKLSQEVESLSKNAEKAKKELDEASQKIDSFSAANNTASLSVSDLSRGFGHLSLEMLGLFEVVTSVSGLIRKSLKDALDVASLKNFSDSLGLNAKDVDAWGRAFRLAGGHISEFRSVIGDISKSLVAMRYGGAQQFRLGLTRLGITPTDAQGRMKSPFELLEQIRRAATSTAIKTPIKRLAFQELGMTLDELRILGTRRLLPDVAMEKKRQPLTPDLERESKDFQRTIGLIKDAGDALGRRLIPALDDGAKVVLGFVDAVNDDIKIFGIAINGIAHAIDSAIKYILGLFDDTEQPTTPKAIQQQKIKHDITRAAAGGGEALVLPEKTIKFDDDTEQPTTPKAIQQQTIKHDVTRAAAGGGEVLVLPEKTIKHGVDVFNKTGDAIDHFFTSSKESIRRSESQTSELFAISNAITQNKQLKQPPATNTNTNIPSDKKVIPHLDAHFANQQKYTVPNINTINHNTTTSSNVHNDITQHNTINIHDANDPHQVAEKVEHILTHHYTHAIADHDDGVFR